MIYRNFVLDFIINAVLLTVMAAASGSEMLLFKGSKSSGSPQIKECSISGLEDKIIITATEPKKSLTF